MKTLPEELLLEKNQLNTSAWLIFLDVTLTDGTIFYLVNNNEDISFFKHSDNLAQLYTATAFDIDSNTENVKGELPFVSLRITNVTRLLQSYLEDLDGAIGSTIILRVVNVDNLSSNYADLTWEFDVVGTSSDLFWVTFTLGMPNPIRRRFPLYRYIATACNWRFKGIECGYTEPIDSYTKLMLHMNGIGTPTVFTDSAPVPHTVTAQGSAALSATDPKFGDASGYFNGSTDYLTIPDSDDWNFGTGNFTIDFCIKWKPLEGTYHDIYTQGTRDNRRITIGYANSTIYVIVAENYVSYLFLHSEPWVITPNTWYHVAVVRNGNILKTYIDGVTTGVGTDLTGITMPDLSEDIHIANYNNSSYCNCWLDEFRISKGIARWTEDFIPNTFEYGSYFSCNRTFDDCEIRNNTARFGGFLGLKQGGLRVVF
jgi:phage-related protein